MKAPYIIALPTKNEEESLAEVVDAIRELDIPLFIVDGNSTDKTLEIANKLDLEVYQRDELGQGYGCGIRKALIVAQEKGYEYMGMVDCDSTYPIDAFVELKQKLGDKDLVIGARKMEQIKFWHRMANYIHSITASILFNRKVLDINSGMRILKVQTFIDHLDAYNMGLVAQMSSFAYRNNLAMVEVPINYGERKGESKIRIWDTLIILWHMFNERFKKRLEKK